MISSVRAVSNLIKYVDARTRAKLLRREWQGIMYNYAIQGRPAPEVPEIGNVIGTWGDIVAGALAQPDYHMRELLFYAKEGHSGLSEDFLRFTAARALSYISREGFNK